MQAELPAEVRGGKRDETIHRRRSSLKPSSVRQPASLFSNIVSGYERLADEARKQCFNEHVWLWRGANIQTVVDWAIQKKTQKTTLN